MNEAVSTWAVTATYNEAENLPELAAGLLALPTPVTLVIVDDNSPDGPVISPIARRRAPRALHALHRLGRLRLAHPLGIQYALDHGARRSHHGRRPSHDPERTPTCCGAGDVMVVGSAMFGGRRSTGPRPQMLSRTAGMLVRLARSTGRRPHRRFPVYRASSSPRRSSMIATPSCPRCSSAACGRGRASRPITFVDRRYGRSKLSKRIILEAALNLFSLGRRRLTGWRP